MSEATDLIVQEWQSVFRQVIIRAICDALGYTNISPTKRAHAEAVKDAQEWFLNPDEYFELACMISGVDTRKVREAAVKLIQAKWSGDYSRVPEFWREVFTSNRMPSLTNIERALDHLEAAS